MLVGGGDATSDVGIVDSRDFTLCFEFSFRLVFCHLASLHLLFVLSSVVV